ncbi:hypothetical protein [Brucella rhizosphaerae]|uniref:hypothetical protein n=1 Tax=Brucella rhizosphaerae TaxID=571254 RepID=UPI003620ADCD
MIAKMTRKTRSNLPSSIADGLAEARDQIEQAPFEQMAETKSRQKKIWRRFNV